MKSSMVFVAFSLFASLAFADATADSKFTQLNNFFSQGTLPSQGDMTGVWSGRCYHFNDQNNPTGNMLIAESVAVAPATNDGPLFPQPPYKMTFNVVIADNGPDTPADRYDTLTAYDSAGLSEFIKSETFGRAAEATQNGAMVSYTADVSLQFEVRKYENYFIGQVIAHTLDSGFAVGTEISSCYFFKKVRE